MVEKLIKKIPKMRTILVPDGEIEEISYKCSDGQEFQREDHAKEHEKKILRDNSEKQLHQLLISSNYVYHLTYHYSTIHMSGWINFKTEADIRFFFDIFEKAFPWATLSNTDFPKLNTWLLFCYSSESNYDGDDRYLVDFTSLDELKKIVELIVKDFPVDNERI